MSLHEYQASHQIATSGHPFYGIIMAAMRKADSINLAKLRREWPDVWAELDARYHLPEGKFPSEADTPGEGTH
jgi:hypothetical protein